MDFQTLKWTGGVDGFLELIDQRRLPGKFITIKCNNLGQVHEAIKTMSVRGAPAIGVTAAYGVVIGLRELPVESTLDECIVCLEKASDYLATSRPTAVNLFWALDRVKEKGKEYAAQNPESNVRSFREIILAEADAIFSEDVEMCRRIGQNGQKFIQDGDSILTHCNAGALATAGGGTALSLIFEAGKKGKKLKVYADETRPLLQGARLTAWELKQAEIDVTVICDNMAGWLMKQGKIDLIVTGADRIAANGDTANKIGTYSLSVLAKEHGIPFYVAAPSSTFDLDIKSGNEIPIEQRKAEEVTTIGKVQIVPDGINVYNPAFDVTEASYITAIITEKGVIERPNADNICKCLKL